MEAAAKFDFEATADDELSFRKGGPLMDKEDANTCYTTHTLPFQTMNGSQHENKSKSNTATSMTGHISSHAA